MSSVGAEKELSFMTGGMAPELARLFIYLYMLLPVKF